MLGDIRDPVSAINRITRRRRAAAGPARSPRMAVPGQLERSRAPRSTRWSLLTGWLTGTSLPDLAQAHLAAAADPAWRIEQMVDAVTEHFEHYLAWTVGAPGRAHQHPAGRLRPRGEVVPRPGQLHPLWRR